VGVLAEAYTPRAFRGDTLFDLDRPRGLPIGNLTSQFWANVYLNPFDHFVKRELGCAAYLRYVDDFILFADDKTMLQEWREAIVARLARLRLTIHPGAQARLVTEGLPFLGFVVFPMYRRLKRRKGVAFARRYNQLRRAYHSREISLEQLTASVRGWINHVRYGDTWSLRCALLASHLIKSSFVV
jgi:RNA-directed DNA polymerase